jgi:molybdate transport system substrate-binding protein
MALTGAVAAAVVALAVLGARGDADTALVFAPSSLAPFEAELDAALIESGIGPVEWVFAGSQSLVAQLIDGAPADVLITADAVTFARANAAGVTWDDGRDLVANRLVLAVAPGNPGGVTSLDDLAAVACSSASAPPRSPAAAWPWQRQTAESRSTPIPRRRTSGR